MRPVAPEDTIAALATAPGEAGIAVVRLSGGRALAIADALFRSKKNLPPSRQEARTVQVGWAVDAGADTRGGQEKRLDEVLLLVLRGPKSYTGEDTVELSCHGGRLAVQKILDACVRAGARVAEPGEFTRRSFLNGRMDLAQAEAVLDLIRARSDRAYQAAQSQLQGDLSKFVRRTRDELARILSHIEAAIDFPDDRIEPMTDKEVLQTLRAVAAECARLTREARSGAVARDGIKVVLAGPPNAGKSSLMNALVRKSRVIVSPEPGTTRDTIEEDVQIGGIRVRLVDTAGLQDTASPVERQGIERSREEIGTSDLVLCVLDGSARPGEAERRLWEACAPQNRFLIHNKADLAPAASAAESRPGFEGALAVLKTSCLDGTGIAELERRIGEFAARQAPAPSEEAWVLSSRHLEHFRKAAGHVAAAAEACQKGLSGEFPATDVRLALEELGRVAGEVVTDDVLDLIFDQFCIGK